jgi:hypothetical protein
MGTGCSWMCMEMETNCVMLVSDEWEKENESMPVCIYSGDGLQKL